MLIIVSGVSGSGKDTIINEIIERQPCITRFPSYTTRDKRPHETNGNEYYFVSKEQFEDMIVDNKLFEYSIHHNNYYGICKDGVEEKLKKGEILIKDVDVNGTRQLMEAFRNKYEIITIFLDISKEEMLDRLEKRGDLKNEEDLKRRIDRYDYERKFIDIYDHVIQNHNLATSVNEVEKIILNKLNNL